MTKDKLGYIPIFVKGDNPSANPVKLWENSPMFDESSIGGHERIAKRLLPELEKLGLKRQPASEAAGLGDSFIRDITQLKPDGNPRTRDPGYISLRKLGELIGKSPAWIMGDDKNLVESDIQEKADANQTDAALPRKFPRSIDRGDAHAGFVLVAKTLIGKEPDPAALDLAVTLFCGLVEAREDGLSESDRINRIFEFLSREFLNVAPQPLLESDDVSGRNRRAALHLLGILALADSDDPSLPASQKAQ